jgi:hypothetical protein
VPLRPSFLVPLFVVATAALGIGFAAPAAADCNYSGGTTLCSSTGTVRGGSAPPPATFNPYPCNGDPTCDYYDNWDPNIYLDIGRPGIGIGGRPGRG